VLSSLAGLGLMQTRAFLFHLVAVSGIEGESGRNLSE